MREKRAERDENTSLSLASLSLLFPSSSLAALIPPSLVLRSFRVLLAVSVGCAHLQQRRAVLEAPLAGSNRVLRGHRRASAAGETRKVRRRAERQLLAWERRTSDEEADREKRGREGKRGEEKRERSGQLSISAAGAEMCSAARAVVHTRPKDRKRLAVAERGARESLIEMVKEKRERDGGQERKSFFQSLFLNRKQHVHSHIHT